MEHVPTSVHNAGAHTSGHAVATCSSDQNDDSDQHHQGEARSRVILYMGQPSKSPLPYAHLFSDDPGVSRRGKTGIVSTLARNACTSGSLQVVITFFNSASGAAFGNTRRRAKRVLRCEFLGNIPDTARRIIYRQRD
jgi:hypothetical protein